MKILEHPKLPPKELYVSRQLPLLSRSTSFSLPLFSPSLSNKAPSAPLSPGFVPGDATLRPPTLCGVPSHDVLDPAREAALTGGGRIFEYTKAADPDLSPVPAALALRGPTDGPSRVVAFDLSAHLRTAYPATSPNLLVGFVRLLAGETVAAPAVAATSQAFYVLAGKGASVSDEHGLIPWAAGDMVVLPKCRGEVRGGDDLSYNATHKTERKVDLAKSLKTLTDAVEHFAVSFFFTFGKCQRLLTYREVGLPRCFSPSLSRPPCLPCSPHPAPLSLSSLQVRHTAAAAHAAQLFWVHDGPLLAYLGAAPSADTFAPTVIRREAMLKEVTAISHEPGAAPCGVGSAPAFSFCCRLDPVACFLYAQ